MPPPAFTLPLTLPRQTSPILPRTPRCTITPPQPTNTEALRAAYKSAKAAYKSAKRPDITTSTPPDLPTLEATYRHAKARYKASKYTPTPIPTSTTPPSTTPPSQNPAAVPTVVVCGGRTCSRLGADAVASMLRTDPPSAKCMKRCGGVGPTVSLEGVPVKVNFRKAVSEALRAAAEKN